MKHGISALTAAALACAAGQAQVVINEAFENPPGSLDERHEFLEIYGEPGTDLTGYAIALVKGARDIDGDDIPEALVEIDEAFQFDGIVIGSAGLVVLYNDTAGPAVSLIPGMVTNPNVVVRSFNQQHIPATDVAGKLGNDDSSTYLLLRRRPADPNDVMGYAWRKDVDPDPIFSGHISFGPPLQPGAPILEAYQVVDEVAWSHNGGKEYTRSKQQEISDTRMSDTVGFNPDGVSRLHYYGANPQHGWRFDAVNGIEYTRMADEEWIYGDMVGLVSPLSYEPTRAKGPTDLAASGFDGTCNPDADPQCLPNGGPYKITDISLAGFTMTPGAMNDSGLHTQSRFIRGDFDFSGACTATDYKLIQAHFHERMFAAPLPDLDETEIKVFDNDTPTDLADDYTYTGWKFEGRELNGVLAMMNMDKTDGTAGANADSVTGFDVREAALGGCGMADLSGSADPNDSAYGVADGVIDSADFFYFLDRFVDASFEADMSTNADPNDPLYGVPDGVVDAADFFFYLDRFVEG